MELITPEAKIEEVDALLDDYQEKVGLRIDRNLDSVKYLNLSQTDLLRMGPDEVDIAAVALAQYNTYLQKILNKEVARVNWCEAYIKVSIAKSCPNFNAYSYEERRSLAIGDNDWSCKLNKLKIAAQSRVDRLTNISMALSTQIKTLLSLSQSKRARLGKS